MAEQHDFERWREIREIQKSHVDLYKRLGGFVVAGLLILFGIWIGRSSDDKQIEAFDLNLTTEFIGMVVTVGLFGLISQWQGENRYKTQLIDEATSKSNEIAKHAIHIMQRRNWLKGGRSILIRATLVDANLSGADLNQVNLREVNLMGSNLQAAFIADANLKRANLRGTQLQNAWLSGTNFEMADFKWAEMQQADLSSSYLYKSDLSKARLQEADLAFADLRYTNCQSANFEGADFTASNCAYADFTFADLTGANLSHANLENANLAGARFSRETTLPDGTHLINPTVVNMRRFTDPSHPYFWRSLSEISPASRNYQPKPPTPEIL